MNLKKCFFTENRCYQKAQKVKGAPVGILLHSTGANNKQLKRYVQPSPSDPAYETLIEVLGRNRYGNHQNRAAASTCLHAFVGVEASGRVASYHVLPFEYCAWGCGMGKRGSYNYNPTAHIQIELCEDDLSDSDYFDAVFAEAAELCAHLCRLYGLTEAQIVSHKEAHRLGYASNHGDPDHWLKKFGKDMDWFRAQVAALLSASEEQAQEQEAFKPYLVRVTASALNYRAGAGTDYKINGVIRGGGVFTIVAEQTVGNSTWGKLKSGAGWISLRYTKRL